MGPILGPFSSWGTELEVHKSCHDFAALGGEDGVVDVIVVFKVVPEGFSILGLAIEGFRGGSNDLSAVGCSAGRHAWCCGHGG